MNTDTDTLRKFIVTIKGNVDCFDITVTASSLEDAHEVFEEKCEKLGFEITRVRPKVSHKG